MGDYTRGFLEIIGGSDTFRQAAYAALHAYDEYDFPADRDLDYYSGEWLDEVALDWADEVKERLARVVEETPLTEQPAWILVETEARYEWHGDRYRWLPDLGWHHVAVGNDGNPAIGVDGVAAWLELPLGEATEAFARFLGTAWVRPTA